MFTFLKITFSLSVLAVFVSAFLPVVEELPYGMDEALVFFFSTVRAMFEFLPWIVFPFSLMVLAIVIKAAFLLWVFARWLYSIFT